MLELRKTEIISQFTRIQISSRANFCFIIVAVSPRKKNLSKNPLLKKNWQKLVTFSNCKQATHFCESVKNL